MNLGAKFHYWTSHADQGTQSSSMIQSSRDSKLLRVKFPGSKYLVIFN